MYYLEKVECEDYFNTGDTILERLEKTPEQAKALFLKIMVYLFLMSVKMHI